MSVGFMPFSSSHSYYSSPEPTSSSSVEPSISPAEILESLSSCCSILNLDHVSQKLSTTLPDILEQSQKMTCFEAINTIVLLRAVQQHLGLRPVPLCDQAMCRLRARICDAMTKLSSYEDYVEYYELLKPESPYCNVLSEEEFRDIAYNNLFEIFRSRLGAPRSRQREDYVTFLLKILKDNVFIQFKIDAIAAHKALLNEGQVVITPMQSQKIAHAMATAQNAAVTRSQLPIPSYIPADFNPFYPDPRFYGYRA